MKVLSLLLALLIANFGITSAESEYDRKIFNIADDYMRKLEKVALAGNPSELCKFVTDCTTVDTGKMLANLMRGFEVGSVSIKSVNASVGFFGENPVSWRFELETDNDGASYKMKNLKVLHYPYYGQ